MKAVTYKNLYSLPTDELDNFNNFETENFIFQGSKNWDLYFEMSFENDEVSEFNNVVLINFTEKREFEQYFKTNRIINYSLEHFNELGKYFIFVNNNC